MYNCNRNVQDTAINKFTGYKEKLNCYHYDWHIPVEQRDISRDGLYVGPGSGTTYYHIINQKIYPIRTPYDTNYAWESELYFYIKDGE